MPEETTQQANERIAAEKLVEIERRASINKKFNHEVMRKLREMDDK